MYKGCTEHYLDFTQDVVKIEGLEDQEPTLKDQEPRPQCIDNDDALSSRHTGTTENPYTYTCHDFDAYNLLLP